MPATHGGGRACYKGFRLKTGSCEPCRTANARQHTNYNRSPRARANAARYRATARGMLTNARSVAQRRKS